MIGYLTVGAGVLKPRRADVTLELPIVTADDVRAVEGELRGRLGDGNIAVVAFSRYTDLA
jgi:hypothetical protein